MFYIVATPSTVVLVSRFLLKFPFNLYEINWFVRLINSVY